MLKVLTALIGISSPESSSLQYNIVSHLFSGAHLDLNLWDCQYKVNQNQVVFKHPEPFCHLAQSKQFYCEQYNSVSRVWPVSVSDSSPLAAFSVDSARLLRSLAPFEAVLRKFPSRLKNIWTFWENISHLMSLVTLAGWEDTRHWVQVWTRNWINCNKNE